MGVVQVLGLGQVQVLGLKLLPVSSVLPRHCAGKARRRSHSGTSKKWGGHNMILLRESSRQVQVSGKCFKAEKSGSGAPGISEIGGTPA